MLFRSSAFKITVGIKAIESIRLKEAKLVFISSDASKNTIKKVIDKCTYYQVEAFIRDDFSLLANAIGKDNIMYFAINDKGFAQAIKETMK